MSQNRVFDITNKRYNTHKKKFFVFDIIKRCFFCFFVCFFFFFFFQKSISYDITKFYFVILNRKSKLRYQKSIVFVISKTDFVISYSEL